MQNQVLNKRLLSEQSALIQPTFKRLLSNTLAPSFLTTFLLLTCILTCILSIWNGAVEAKSDAKAIHLNLIAHDFVFFNYTFRNGQLLPELTIHCVTLGTPQKNTEGEITNAVLLLHWTNASSQVFLTEDFIQSLYSPGKPLDINKYFLILIDSVGHGQSSKPSQGLRTKFPEYGYLDMVAIQHAVVQSKLGINHLKMIIGASMGGMHTWLWSELYPKFMDGVMPIVSLPARVSGRNLLWRQLVIQAIKNDPEWQHGNYVQQPYSLVATWPFARMLLDGLPHLEKIVPDIAQAEHFIQEAQEATRQMDANDLIYVLNASRDYAPESALHKIETKVYALDFADDQLDPAKLGVLKRAIQFVKQGKAVIQPATQHSYGHLTMAHPNLWADQVTEFIQFIEQN